VKIGGKLSDRKGINVRVILPLSPFTEKDRCDLIFGLNWGRLDRAFVVQKAEKTITEARALIGSRA